MLVLSITLSSFLHTIVHSNAIINSTNNGLEYYQHLRTRRQNFNGFEFVDCVLPPHPSNGQWIIISGSGRPGSTILPNTLIKFSCNPGYELVPKNEYFLCDSEWNPEKMPHCMERLCPPLTSSSSTSVRCFGSGEPISCSKAYNGNTATVKCSEYHEISNGQEGSMQCINEKWSSPVPVCEPICGKEVNENDIGPLLAGKKGKIPKYPWVITIFKKTDTGNTYICSGTLLSTTLILTAAHCVTDYHGELKQAKDYQIAAGKAYSTYGDPRDLMAQYVNVDSLIIQPDFKGITSNYRGDIALLKTKRPLRLSPLVQPICFRGLTNITLLEGEEGVVSLWGQKKEGGITDEVRVFKIRTDEKCKRKLPETFARNYLTEEKLCSFFEEEDDPLCTGTSGAGWVFKNPKDNRYYIHGIISLGSRNSDTFCAEPATLSTKVLSYYDFVNQKMTDL